MLATTSQMLNLGIGSQRDFSIRIEENGGGTITADGVYTAPVTPGVYHVVALRSATGERSTATITVEPFFGNPPAPISRLLERFRVPYKMVFLDDGFPAVYDNGDVWVQPLYGIYLLRDYLMQYSQTPTSALKQAIAETCDAALRRMVDYEGALVFWYPAGKNSSQPNRHYSALTQSYYALHFYEAYEITREPRFLRASQEAFESLLVPHEKGGVLYRWAGGAALSEVPTNPDLFVLDGWLSTLTILQAYAEKAHSEPARALFAENVTTLARLLPVFDAPAYKNSRSVLSGPLRFRLVFGPAFRILRHFDRLTVLEAGIEIPGAGYYPFGVTADAQAYVHPADVNAAATGWTPTKRRVRLQGLLSRISFPEPNVLRLTYQAQSEVHARLEVGVGAYDPTTSGPVRLQWEPLSDVVFSEGSHTLRVAIPWEQADLVAYPTNFGKIFEGDLYNVYHFIHIDELNNLYRLTGVPTFREYAEKWDGYTKSWPTERIYQNVKHTRFLFH